MNPVPSTLNMPSELHKQLAHRPRLRFLSQRVVYALCVGGIIFLIVFDLRLADDGKPDNTWSELMRTYGQRHLILPWLCGILIGHLYHHHDNLSPRFGLSDQQAYNTIGWLSALLIPVGFIAQLAGWVVPQDVMTLVAIIGIAVGYYIWPVKRKVEQWTW